MLRQLQGQTAEEEQLSFYLLGYRWISLLPPFLALFLTSGRDTFLRIVFLTAIADNLFLTLLQSRANHLVIRFPWILGFDLFIAAAFLALTGRMISLFYLYALSPLLAAASFFRMRGALVAASVFTMCYALASLPAATPVDNLRILSQIISFFVIAILFGYAALPSLPKACTRSNSWPTRRPLHSARPNSVSSGRMPSARTY